MMDNKNRKIFSSRSWVIWVPSGLVLLTAALGFLGGYGNKPLATSWLSLGHLLGATTFDPLPEQVGSDGWQCFVFLASLCIGLLLIPYAFFLLVHEQYRDQITQIRIRLWRIRGKRFIVVCGLGQKGCSLVKSALEMQGERFGVVGVDMQNPVGSIKGLSEKGMAFFQADETNFDALKKAGVLYAKEIFVMSGDDEADCRIAIVISQLLPEEKELAVKLNCYVSAVNNRMRAFIEDYAKNQVDRLHIHCFDINEQAARKVIQENG